MNRLCGSGMQAIVSAAQAIMLGDCEVAVAGGAESMSRVPYWLPGMRWGQRMSDGVAIDPMVGALTDPFDGCHMGVTAENVATDYHVSREDQDALAAESHRRAAAATAAGYFKEQILPVEIPGRKGKITIVDTDEHIRADVSLDDMARLRPAFAKDGTVTAGNASGINDAAAAVVLASESFVNSNGFTPLGRLVGYGHAGVEPRIMGMGPVPATRKVLDRTGLKVDEIDVFEVNEAFAAQALAVVRELDLPPSAPTRTAAGSPSATRSAPPGPSWSSSRCTSSSAPAAGTRSTRCASAAGRASPRSSSGSEPGRADDQVGPRPDLVVTDLHHSGPRGRETKGSET